MTGGRVTDPALRRWLGRSNLQAGAAREELLSRITRVLDVPCPRHGLAALRMWGQTGDRPTVWLAAADPVYLEPRLDHLSLHSMRRTGVPATDLRPLFEHLQDLLAEGTDFGFARLGTFGYVRADRGFATASLPSYAVHGEKPDRFLPAGEGADAYRRLVSEIEMALHEHAVNARRQECGLRPINSLWIWGGGKAPQQQRQQLPVLFADDPLPTGYWESGCGDSSQWPGSIDACLEDTEKGVVAITPEFVDDPGFLEDCLNTLRAALRSRAISKAVILSRDGLQAEIRRAHSSRFWRRGTRLLGEPV